MKILAFILLMISISTGAVAQKPGSKKNIILELMSYDCGDACAIIWKDVNSGTLYGFENVDEKTKDNGILPEIQQTYYANGESDKKIKGTTYKALMEYRYTYEYENQNPDEPARRTGRKRARWMINLLEKR